MQWLIQAAIDQVIADIGGPPIFIDRGDPIVADFSIGDFTLDGNVHFLDLSGIVSAGAKAVTFQSHLECVVPNVRVQLFRAGNLNATNRSEAIVQIANQDWYQEMLVACNEARNIAYRFTFAPWTITDFTIKGWWL